RRRWVGVRARLAVPPGSPYLAGMVASTYPPSASWDIRLGSRRGAQRAPHFPQQPVRRKGLAQQVDVAPPQLAQRVDAVGVSGNQQYAHPGIEAAQLLAQVEAIHAGHDDVADHQLSSHVLLLAYDQRERRA